MEEVFAALDSQIRRQILVYLATGDLTLSEICSRFDRTAPAVLRHMRVLEAAGLVTRKAGRFAPYSIVSDKLVAAFNAFLGTVHPRVGLNHEEDGANVGHATGFFSEAESGLTPAPAR